MKSRINLALTRLFRLGSKTLQKTGIADIEIRGSRVRTRISRIFLPLVVRNIPNPVSVNGHKFFHGGAVSKSMYSYVYSDYEPATVRLFGDILRPGDVVYDAGSHIGYFSVIAAEKVGRSGHVYSFEASGETAGYLRKTVKANGFDDTVTVVEKAIADRVGKITFSASKKGSTARAITTSEGRGGTVEVDATTLDAHWQESSRAPVRLLKVDVEGYELKCLENSAELLAASPEAVVVFETRTHDREHLDEHHAVMGLLAKYGFTHSYVLHDEDRPEELAPGAVPDSGRYHYLNIAASKQPLKLT